MEELENDIRQLDYIRKMINEYMLASDKNYKELIEALNDERKCNIAWKN